MLLASSADHVLVTEEAEQSSDLPCLVVVVYVETLPQFRCAITDPTQSLVVLDHLEVHRLGNRVLLAEILVSNRECYLGHGPGI